MSRRTQVVVAAAIALFGIAMLVIWFSATMMAKTKTTAVLLESRDIFANIAEKQVQGVLWYASNQTLERLGRVVRKYSVEEMQRLASEIRMDEFNIVDSNGIVIASNMKETLGYDFNKNERTAEFVQYLGPKGIYDHYDQPFRPSSVTPDWYCKYHGVVFPGRSAFLQIGLTMSHVARILKYETDVSDYQRLSIGQYGHYEIADRDRDGYADSIDLWPEIAPNKGVFSCRQDKETGGTSFVYTFDYSGLIFQAIVPESEFYDQRNRNIVVSSLLFAGFLTLAAYFLICISNSSEKLAAMHKAEDIRNAADLSLARQIQMSAMPNTTRFRLGSLDSIITAITNPAREVGGDFYDAFETDDGRIAFLVADVSGKGVPAAMFMLIVKNTFLHFFSLAKDMSQCAAMANDYLCEHNSAEMFVTAFIALVDPKTGELEYVNAGHNRPYLLGDGGAVRIDGKSGIFMGIFPKVEYRSYRLQLKRGDCLLLYTDGVTEAMNREHKPYGEERLRRLLATKTTHPCEAVRNDVEEYVAGGERSDDLTVLAFTWQGEQQLPIMRKFPCCESSLAEAMAFLKTELDIENRKKRLRVLNALDEVVSNVVNYSGSKDFRLTIERIPNKTRITVADSGVPYNPLTHADPDTHASIENRPIGGLGILMTKHLVDLATYDWVNGENLLTLVQLDDEL